MLRRLLTREDGFGLLELVIAMAILNVGILALVATLNSGAIAIRRASKVTTATTLADAQLERYRALQYDAIATAAPEPDDRYEAAAPAGTPDYSCADEALPECDPIQTVTGPDSKPYRIDTYVVTGTLDEGSRELKTIRIIVRDGSQLDHVLVRQESTFYDEAFDD
jgi:type II secretory pathway pseudopilin PulG